MTQAYLFDWGDTLMVDFPAKSGPMMEWDEVAAITGTASVLEELAKTSKIYVATGAPQATPQTIAAALQRVDLHKYIADYFCPLLIGYSKKDNELYLEIARRIGLPAAAITMVGDSLMNDVYPALAAGMKAIWFNERGTFAWHSGFLEINVLQHLCVKDND